MSEQNPSAFLVRRRIHHRTKGNKYNFEPMLVYAGSVNEAHEKLKKHFESITYAKVTETVFRDGSKSIEVGMRGMPSDETCYYSIVEPIEITQIN